MYFALYISALSTPRVSGAIFLFITFLPIFLDQFPWVEFRDTSSHFHFQAIKSVLPMTPPWMSCSIVKRISDLISAEDGWCYTWWVSVCPPLIPTDFSLHCTPASLNNKAYNKIQMIPSESTNRLMNRSMNRLIIQPPVYFTAQFKKRNI